MNLERKVPRGDMGRKVVGAMPDSQQPSPRPLPTNLMTKYGFIWENVQVMRACSDKYGLVLLIRTNNKALEIHVTPSGRIKSYPIEVSKVPDMRIY